MHITGLTKFEEDFNTYSKKAGNNACIAVSLLVPALIVLFCSSLVLTINGVNVNNIMLKAFTPSCAALVLSIFFFYQARFPSIEKKKKRTEWIQDVMKKLDEKKDALTVEDILDQLPKTGVRDNKQRFLSELKEEYSKDKEKNKEIITKLDKALQQLITEKKKKLKTEKKK